MTRLQEVSEMLYLFQRCMLMWHLPRSWLHPSRKGDHTHGNSSGHDVQMNAIQLDWRIEPTRLKICQYPDGRLWQLGSGGYGTVG